jgi:hypothetical protein
MVLTIACAAAAAPPRSAERQRQPKPSSSNAAVIVIENTLEATLAQPRVRVQLSDKGGPLTGKPADDAGLRELLGDEQTVDRSFIAFLDTGASGHVISKSTAERFGVTSRENAIYHEVGLHGETQVGVSMPYQLGLAGVDGQTVDDDLPKEAFATSFENVAFQLALKKPVGLMAIMGEMNVIGMPAIRTMAVALDPAPMRNADQGGKANGGPLEALERLSSLANGPTVRIISGKGQSKRERTAPDDRDAMKDADIVFAFEYEDFNQRKHPGNRGPLPDLASNPMVPAVTCEVGATSTTPGDNEKASPRTAKGDWLFDTGAAASIISVKTAQALGLYDDAGIALAKPDFTLPLGGVSGEVKFANGYIIDRITIAAKNGKSIEFRQGRVVVQDVGIKLADGRERILDGVLGMNFFLPSGADFGQGVPAKTDNGAFDMIWIDGPRAALALKLRKK